MLVGDALGVPYEFHRREQIPALELIEFTPPAGFNRSHRGVPPGTFSDDGAQALCLLSSLLYCGKLDTDDLGQRLVGWYEQGFMAVDGDVFDCGVQTSRALRAMMGGEVARLAGPAEEQANGNGSLMRVLPRAVARHPRACALAGLLRALLPLGAPLARSAPHPLGRRGVRAAHHLPARRRLAGRAGVPAAP
jgi:ADP-ribosyl-[dinitrogen reductase] hydrolase